MKSRLLALALAAVAVASSTARAQQGADFWTKPAIKDYGPVHVWPQAVLRPDAKTTYKAVFDVTKAGPEDKVNPSLDHIARTVNVFAAAGVPLTHLKFVVIIHGPATPAALSDQEFQAKFNRANPDAAVLAQLAKAGVQVLVCGNALGDFKYDPSMVNPGIKVALSAMSTLVILQDQGYAVMYM
ncbi:MAG: DsrE family protein [Gemmatimonadota bacterium]|nr:DsrE family protein [Gemmatimonadota bacterium]MDE3174257.1 DsrE family protein [Gemmatimonadota bacterium]MDE3217077.1 DsrE family protein [Gemmatimonadota bacterium]